MFIKHWTILQLKIIITIMKNNPHLLFKKCKSWPNWIDLDAVIMKRRLFKVKFSRILQDGTLIVNIDESIIWRDSQISYSWGHKGTPLKIKKYSHLLAI